MCECVEPGISSALLSEGRQTRCVDNDAACVSGPFALQPCNALKPEALVRAEREREEQNENKTQNIQYKTVSKPRYTIKSTFKNKLLI